jgi:hypothetical protein
MLDRLMAQAREHGLEVMDGEVLADNHVTQRRDFLSTLSS